MLGEAGAQPVSLQCATSSLPVCRGPSLIAVFKLFVVPQVSGRGE